MSKTTSISGTTSFEAISQPTPWPGANARLLGLGMGLPVNPLSRLAQFSAADFERFTLEWASDYLASKLSEIVEVQQRGGAGDKGRDVIAWLDPSSTTMRRWRLYQCKHYGAALGAGTALGEIAKVLFYTYKGDYTPPIEYYFVTHKGVTSPFQDLLDVPKNLRNFVITNWNKHCREAISKDPVELDASLRTHIEGFDFSVFRAKQPLELLDEHRKTRYHLTVFGLPLIDRAKPPAPPSEVDPGETRYVEQLFSIIGAEIGSNVTSKSDFQSHAIHCRLFDRSRITFYSAEGLKELARDQMANVKFFNVLLEEFRDGLFHWYSEASTSGYIRLINTVKGAQSLQLGGHPLAPHVLANDREGMCHQMANEGFVQWCAL